MFRYIIKLMKIKFRAISVNYAVGRGHCNYVH